MVNVQVNVIMNKVQVKSKRLKNELVDPGSFPTKHPAKQSPQNLKKTSFI